MKNKDIAGNIVFEDLRDMTTGNSVRVSNSNSVSSSVSVGNSVSVRNSVSVSNSVSVRDRVSNSAYSNRGQFQNDGVSKEDSDDEEEDDPENQSLRGMVDIAFRKLEEEGGAGAEEGGSAIQRERKTKSKSSKMRTAVVKIGASKKPSLKSTKTKKDSSVEMEALILDNKTDLTRADVEKLMANKDIKKARIKELLANEIRRHLKQTRVSISFLDKEGVEVSKPVSKCNVDELGDFLLSKCLG